MNPCRRKSTALSIVFFITYFLHNLCENTANKLLTILRFNGDFMRLDQPIDVMGKFWLPEQSEQDGVTGRLIIEDGCNIDLTIYGEFKGEDILDYMGERQGDIDRIVGMLFQEQSGQNSGYSRQFVTLDGCLFSQSSYDCEIIKYKINFAFMGAIYEPKEKVEFDEYSFTSDGLDAFLLKYPFYIERDLSTNKENFTVPNSRIVSLGEYRGAQIDLIFNYDHPSTKTEARINQSHYIRLRTNEPRDWIFFKEIAFNLLQFLSFACNDTADFGRVKGYLKNNSQNLLNITIFFKNTFSIQTSSRFSLNNMLFTYAKVEHTFNERLQHWFVLCEKIKPALRLFSSIQAIKVGLLEVRFITIAQALENLAKYWPEDTQILDHNDHEDDEYKTYKERKSLIEKKNETAKALVEALREKMVKLNKTGEINTFFDESDIQLLIKKLGAVAGISSKTLFIDFFALLNDLKYNGKDFWEEKQLKFFVDDFIKTRNRYTHHETKKKIMTMLK